MMQFCKTCVTGNEGNKNPKRNSEVNICQVMDKVLYVTGVMMDLLNFSTILKKKTWPKQIHAIRQIQVICL